MTESERLLRRVGAVKIPCRSHTAYRLHGELFTLHTGGSKPCFRELIKVKSRLRKMGLYPVRKRRS